jgi:hypothetical protein
MVKRPNAWNIAVLNDWATGFKDRDGKFVKEFQTTFNACFWELYVNAVLREYKLSVDWRFASPDFTVTAPWPFTIEATIASNADGSPPEHRRADARLPEDLNEFNRQAILRLSNSLVSKYRKFKSHYARLAHVKGKPFVIALASFDRPHFYLECQRPLEALLFNYYVDEENYFANAPAESPIPRLFLPSVRKSDEAVIALGLFQNGGMPEVSAVLFSNCATWGKVRALSDDPNPNIHFTALRSNPHSPRPQVMKCLKCGYRESLLDGLRVYHNPGALYPLDPAIFRNQDVFQVYYCHDREDWIYEHADRQLLSRRVWTVNSGLPYGNAVS